MCNMGSGGRDPSYITFGGLRVHRAWVVLIGCCFLQAGSLGLILGSSGVFQVPVCSELGFTRSEFSLYITAYFLSSVVAMPLAGRLLTRFRARVVISVAAVACALAAAMMSTYTQVWQFVLSGIVYGTFGSCVFQVPSASMLGNWFRKRAGLAMGIGAAAASLSTAAIAPLYSVAIQAMGWRATYVLQGCLVLAFILPWSLTVFRLTPQEIGAVPYGYAPDEEGAVQAEEAQERGVSIRNALRSVSFFALFVFAGIAALIGSGFDSHMPSFAQSRGFDPLMAATLVSSIQIGSLVEKLLMGTVNDRIGVHRTVYLEFAIVAVGIIGLLVSTEPWQLLFFGFLFGVQDSFTSISVPLMIRQVFGLRNYTRIYAWARTGFGIFGGFSVWFVGLCYDLTGSYTAVFCMALGACALGAVLVTVVYAFRKRLVWEG